MWRLLLVCLIFPNLAQAVEPVARIIGGSNVQDESWPWMVSIGRDGAQTNYDALANQICGGSLVSSRWVLTAAHCVYSHHADALVVHVGEISLQDAVWAQRQKIRRIYVHPDYDPDSLDNDIALLELKLDLIWPQVSVALLSESAITAVDADLLALGWGDSSPDPGIDKVSRLQQVLLTYLPSAVCEQFYPDKLTANMLCTYKPGHDACRGDSGGPLLIDVAGEWMQLGIISWGPVCGNAPYPGVFTRIQTAYVDWMDKVMAGSSVAISEAIPAAPSASSEDLSDDDDGGGGGGGALGVYWLLGLFLLRRARVPRPCH